MKNILEKVFGGVLFLYLLLLFLPGIVVADYVDSVVLIPNADGEGNTFSDTSGCYDHYDCVNDSNDAPCTGDDTTTFVFSSSGIEMYGIVTAPDTSNSMDSMALYICAAEYKSGTSGDDQVGFGWRYKLESEWYYCNNEGGVDTVDIDGHACAIARTSWTNDPCWGETRGLGWIYFGGFYNNAFQLAVYITSIEGGCVGSCTLRLFNVWMVYYVTVMEAAGQVIIIGQRSDFHRPKTAKIEWREI